MGDHHLGSSLAFYFVFGLGEKVSSKSSSLNYKELFILAVQVGCFLILIPKGFWIHFMFDACLDTSERGRVKELSYGIVFVWNLMFC